MHVAGRQMVCSRFPGFGFCPIVSVVFMALVPVLSVFSYWRRQLFSCWLPCRNNRRRTLQPRHLHSTADCFCLYKKRWREFCCRLLSLYPLILLFLALLTFCVHIFEWEQVLVIIISDMTMKISTANRAACTHTPQVCHISGVYWLGAQELWHWSV